MANLPDLLKMYPWHGGDPPGPLGPWIFEHMDRAQLVNIAQAVLDYNKTVLTAQQTMNTKMIEILAQPRAK